MTRALILETLKENKPFLQKSFDVKKIGLFGSYVTDSATETSDIDILVDMPSSFDKYYALKEFLENTFHKKIDLGMEKSLRKLVKEKIAQEIIYV